MDIQTRKLNLISYLAHLQDEVLFKKIEELISKNKELSPFSEEELISRIQKSEEDYHNEKTYTQDELEKISTKW